MTGILDEAYQRLHRSGPEREGWLSNHAPMAVEALARHGHESEVHRWIDGYADKLEDMPARTEPIRDDGWREALGDPRRIGDWAEYLTRQAAERPWRDVLALWWPRLLPGIAAGATHGVIRVGHAVRTLLSGDEGRQATDELAQALAYWAARWQSVPGVRTPAGARDPGAALDAVPHIAEQTDGIRERLARLEGLSGWPGSLAALRRPAGPDDARALLTDLVTASVRRYLRFGYGNGVMLVHAATAPNAVLRVLPALDESAWPDAVATAWAASAAVTAIYAPDRPVPEDELPAAPSGPDPERTAFDLAAGHRDEHVIKLTDTALDVYGWTGDPAALAAAVQATRLIGP